MADHPEVDAVNGEANGLGQKVRPPEEGPHQKLPIIEALPPQDADGKHRFDERAQPPHAQFFLDLGTAVFFQESLQPRVIIFWRVNRRQNFLVSGQKRLLIHERNDIRRAVDVIAGGVTAQAARDP